MKVSSVFLALALLLACFSPGRLWAQADRGSITGEVHDSQGATIPGASLSLRNEATGVTVEGISQAAGQFAFLNLLPGKYVLTTTALGFGKSVKEHIEVNVGGSASFIVSLQAHSDQTIVVSAETASVDTTTSEVGTTITPQAIKDLPVPMTGDMRNPLSFVVLTPGVAGSVPDASGTDYRLHISGSPSYSNEVYIDGIPIVNTNLSGNAGQNHPPIDAISQFKVVNNNQSAQYGLSSSFISFAFNSGTNTYHGSLFEYLQNDKLNANDYVSNALGQKRAPLKQNEYGGTFGGPVRIPKLYNGKDKTFFFVEYTQFSWRPSSNNASLTTFPNRYRTGDFSQSLGPQWTVNGSPVTDVLGRPVYEGAIYNPLSARSVIGLDGKSYVIRDPFPGNIIPSGTPGLSTAAHNILGYFPQASTDATQNNFFRNQSTKNDEHRLVVKIDENFTAKHTLSGSLFMGSYKNGNNGGLNELDSAVVDAPTIQLRFTYNYTHSATVSNNLNAGFLRDKNTSGPSVLGPGLDALGIHGLPVPPGTAPFPGVRLLGNLAASIGNVGETKVAENRFVVNDNLSIIRGQHTFTVGGELRRLQRNENNIGVPGFGFDAPQSALNGTGFINGTTPVSLKPVTGNSGASFLFGAAGGSYSSFPISQGYRWLQIGMYAQDAWKVRPNLTLNLGLRYDIEIPRTEINGYASTVVPNLPNPAAGGIPGAYTFYGNGAGRNGKSRIGNIDFKAFQPRLGFAWSPDAAHKTAIRGGYGITRPVGNDNLENGIGSAQYSIGFSGAAIASTPNDVAGSPSFYLDNGFPSGGVTGATISPGILVGLTNPAIISPKAGSPPTQMNWGLQVQQEMPGAMVATIGYVGAHSYHVGVWSKPNEVDPAVAAKYAGAAQAAQKPLNEFLTLPITDPAAANVPLPWLDFVHAIGIPGATVGQALRPYPQYGSMDFPINPIGSVSYNGLQSSLQKRFSQGLTFLLAYTFSKSMGNVDSNNGVSSGAENQIFAASFYQDYYNPRAERAVTSSDIPHVVALSYTYELPFGRGKKFMDRGGVANAALGGWSVSGIHQYQSGRPIHIEYDVSGASNPYHAADGYSFRPNVVPHQPLKNPAYRQSCSGPITNLAGRQPCQFLINPAAFVAPPAGEFGNAPHFFSSLRLPGYLNENLSASKRFYFTERVDLQFQANFFNAFNRVVFSNGGNPNTFIFNNAPPDLSANSLANSNTVFGIMTNQQNGARIIQFGLKLEF